MTDTTPDIEAVKLGPAKCGHHYNAHCQSCRDAYEWNSATITALQTRVEEAERERVDLAGFANAYRAQLAAAQAEVEQQHRAILGYIEKEFVTAKQLATLRAAIAESLRRAKRYGDGSTVTAAYATEPLRNLDQPEGEDALVAALIECHETLHECTAVLTASDCAKVAAVMARARQALASRGLTVRGEGV